MKINNIKIEFLGHSGFLITDEDKRIAIDPYNISDKIKKVNLILITHSHYDHCSISDIEKLSEESTTIILPADAQSKITKIKKVNMEIIEIGDEIKFKGMKIEAFPAYNNKKNYHPKKEGWLGYLIKIKNTIIYHAGDTNKIPEMKKLTGYKGKKNKFIAFLPVSGEYTMSSEEAAEAALLIKPDLIIPMHYGAGVAGTLKDAQNFIELCNESGLNAKILEKYQ